MALRWLRTLRVLFSSFIGDALASVPGSAGELPWCAPSW